MGKSDTSSTSAGSTAIPEKMSVSEVQGLWKKYVSIDTKDAKKLILGDSVEERNFRRRFLYHSIQSLSLAELSTLKSEYGVPDVVQRGVEVKKDSDKTDEEKMIQLQTDFQKYLGLEGLPCKNVLLNVLGPFRALLAIGAFFVGIAPTGFFMLLMRTFVHPILKKQGVPDHKMPNHKLIFFLGKLITQLLGAEIEVEGRDVLDTVEKNPRPYIGMYTHASNLDPFLVMYAIGGQMGFVWAYKRSLLRVPGIGMVMYGGDQLDGAIDRANRAAAINTCDKIQDSFLPPMVSPEGTRQKTGLIAADLKKGMFYVREARKAQIIPVCITGAYELWPPRTLIPHVGRVRIKICDPMRVPDKEPMTVTRERVRKQMIYEQAKMGSVTLDKKVENPKNSVSNTFLMEHFTLAVPFFISNIWLVCYVLKKTVGVLLGL